MNAALALYSLLTWCVQPLLLCKLRRRALAEPGYAQAVGERFGRYPIPVDGPIAHSATPPGQCVWIHAVSLGETRAAAVLLAPLRERLPGMRLLLTHGTATGRAEGAKLLRAGDAQLWLPWDTPGAVARFLRRFRPAIGILIETEVWPNLIAGCREHGVPLLLANARLSEKSLRRAQRFAALARPAYGALHAVWAQTEGDAARLRALGANVRGVLGNLKFDRLPDADQLAQGRTWCAQTARPVLMLASSREGEEALWLEHFQHLRAQASAASAKAQNPGTAVQWLIVPRHPQRFDEVHRLLESAGLAVSRRSRWGAAPEPADIWLGDSMGEMALYYGLADLALLGGSFAPLGGQNLIEAAACGCPVLLGPHTFNFADAAQRACAAGAAWHVADLRAGMALALELAADATKRQAASARATHYASTHRGAAQATAQAVWEMLRTGAPAVV